MHCLRNIKRTIIPNDTLMKLLKVYEYKGRQIHFENILKKDLMYLEREAVEKDTFYMIKIMQLDVSNYRLKSILRRNSDSKNKAEHIVKNLKSIFESVNTRINELELTSNELLYLNVSLNKNVKDIKYLSDMKDVNINLITEKKRYSRRNDVEQLIEEYSKIIDNNEYESINVIVNSWIDLINLAPFNADNEYIALLFAYSLLIKEGFTVLKYISFFELLYENYELIKQAINEASYNWKENFGDTSSLYNLIIELLIQVYKKIETRISNTGIDVQIKKSYDIENTIQKLNSNVFTKEMIRDKHPTVSLSTIDRTLKRLKEENKIRPTGKGRTASWIKLYEAETFNNEGPKQLSLYDMFISED